MVVLKVLLAVVIPFAANACKGEPETKKENRANSAIVADSSDQVELSFSAEEAGTSASSENELDADLAASAREFSYGAHPKQKIYFWQASTSRDSPLVFFIHGGGWVGGDRLSGGITQILPLMLRSGISVASVEYRFLNEAEELGINPPVRAVMSDVARAIQYLRSRATDLKIDTSRIIAVGNSAGGCAALWLANHDDLANPSSSDPIARQSTRVYASAVAGAQTSLDPVKVLTWIPNIRYGAQAFGFRTFDSFRDSRNKIYGQIAEYSPMELLSDDDPESFMFYQNRPSLGQIQDDPTHSANFGVKMAERMREKNIPYHLVHAGMINPRIASIPEYLLAKLGPNPER